MRLCTQCGTRNDTAAKECSGCGVVFAHLKRQPATADQPSRTCTWMAEGIACQHEWVVNVGGRKLCRQHSIEATGSNPHQVRGNNLPRAYWDSLYGPEAVAKRKQWRHGNRVADDGGETTFAHASTYLRNPPARQREPGDDDEEIV